VSGAAKRRVGLISDTHGLLRPEAVAFLRGSDFIVLEPGGHRIHVQLTEIVHDIDEHLADLEHLGLRHRSRPGARVVVAPDGRDRSEGGELLENTRAPDVASVRWWCQVIRTGRP
jgi:hypothetical protein